MEYYIMTIAVPLFQYLVTAFPMEDHNYNNHFYF